MQAHPQSSPAARIHPTSRPNSPVPVPVKPPAVNSQPSSRVRLRGKVALEPAPPADSLSETAGLAHDAGNLLAGLGLYCDLLSAPGVLRPEHQHYATELSLISNRSSELIRRLIAAQPASSPLKAVSATATEPPGESVSPEPRSANSRAAATDKIFGLLNLAPVLQSIAVGAAKVTLVCSASLPALNFPSEVIERIVVNLVRNAAEAIRLQRSRPDAAGTPRLVAVHGELQQEIQGEIRVALAVVSGRLQLTVEDNGPGLPTSAAAAFLQPSALPRGAGRELGRGPGRGLGHRIVHELATRSAAQISIRVRPGNGTCFCFKWPLPSAPVAAHPSTMELRTSDHPPASSIQPSPQGTIPC